MDYINENLIGILSGSLSGDVIQDVKESRKGILEGFEEGVLVIKIKSNITCLSVA